MRFPHWQFFESLDDELHSFSRVIDFGEDNFATYSVHLTRLYLSIGSEIDVVAKLLCKQISPTAKCKTIDDYRPLITVKYPHFSEIKIEMPAHALNFQPWQSWSTATNPTWWHSYNKVKHERSTYYRDANLGNVLQSAAGLLVMLVYYHQPDLYKPNPTIHPDFKAMRIESKYVRVRRLPVHYNLRDFGKGPSGF